MKIKLEINAPDVAGSPALAAQFLRRVANELVKRDAIVAGGSLAFVANDKPCVAEWHMSRFVKLGEIA
jgi:fructose-1-phosphate kinase PfkB-like protein